MNREILAVLFVAVASAVCGCGTGRSTDTVQSGEVSPIESRGDKEGGVGSFYTVAEYDPDANPAEDLVETVGQASASGKRIILEIGGHW